jgi:hypothetical protein
MQIQDIIRESVGSFVSGIGDFLPSLLAAFVILIVGWIVAKMLKAAVGRGLKLIRFPTLTAKAGIDEFLTTGGLTRTATDLLGVLVYWLVMLIVLVTAVNALGLEVASSLLNEILLYIPNIIASVIVVAVGLYAANFVSAMVRTAAANAGIEEAGLVAGLSRYALIAFTFAIALGQLRIGQELVTNGFLIVFGAASLAAALAIGLGARDFVGRVIEDRFGKGRQ